MSNRTPSGVPGATLRELGLPARTVTVLNRAGVDSVAELATLTRTELAGISGLGPGSIAAIRALLPEPLEGMAPEQAEEESPDAPAIPSFDSLRDPRRRTAMDLLVPAAASAPAPSPAADSSPAAEPSPAAGPAPAGQPRPAEYGDLLRWGVHLAAAAAGLSFRVVRWSVRQPLRRLLGD